MVLLAFTFRMRFCGDGQTIMIECIRGVDGAMRGGIGRAVVVRQGFLRNSCRARVRFLVGSTAGQESGIPNVSVLHLVMVSELI